MTKTDEKSSYSQAQAPSFFNGLAIGMLAGAVGYFLFGTKKGSRVRQKMMQYAEKSWEEAEEVIEQAEQTGKKLEKDVKKVRHHLERKASKAQLAATKELKQLQETVDQAREKADAMQESLRDAAARIERRFFVKNGRSLGK